MAASVNNSVAVGAADNVSTIETAAFAVGGSNRVLYALVGSGAGTPTDPTAVKWGGSGGTSLTQLGSALAVASNVRISLWRLIAPTAQTSTIHATWAGNQDERWIIGVAVADADQTTPNGTVATATGADHTPTVAPTTVSGDLVLDFMSWLDLSGGALTTTVGAGQTSIQELEAGAISNFEGAGSSSETASGASTTMSWSVSGAGALDWGTFGFAVNEAGAGGGATIVPGGLQQVGRGFSGHIAGRLGGALE